MKLKTNYKQILGDLITPVSAYLKVREYSDKSMLLESNEYGSPEDSHSIVGFEPLIQISVDDNEWSVTAGGTAKTLRPEESEESLAAWMWKTIQSCEPEGQKVPINGFFGHSTFEAVRFFDTMKFQNPSGENDIPDLNYILYRYLIVFDHFYDLVYIVENCPEEETSKIQRLEDILMEPPKASGRVHIDDEEFSNLQDDDYRDFVHKAKHHCRIGDVFQMVLSRRFYRRYRGDDFSIYRTLRTVNPSPYLFYYDFGDYCIFGSSPEQQLVIRNNKAYVNPIAGTYKRTGYDAVDRKNAKILAEDIKEQSEHMMLVDLARNDLGRHTQNVRVERLKETKFFSHVIHLVSQVTGELNGEVNPVQVFGDTFPAGTLSGAPKYKAIELIDEYEPHGRSFYGGGIGYFGFDGAVNHAIVIRSVMSKDGVLYYQAGGGLVEKSDQENELKEVENKIGAVRRALDLSKNYFDYE